jgi:hypothetical protein
VLLALLVLFRMENFEGTLRVAILLVYPGEEKEVESKAAAIRIHMKWVYLWIPIQ